MEPAAGILVNEFEPASQGGEALARRQQEETAPGLAAQSAELVQIYCIYTANPSQLLADSVRWFKDGQPLIVSTAAAGGRLQEATTPTGYPVLRISRVQRQDAGAYECQLANSVGQSERLPASESCRLDVNFRPAVQLRLLRVAKGDEGPAVAGGLTDHSGLEEVEPLQALVLARDEFVLACQVLEAQPGRIAKFHWFSGGTSSSGSANAAAGTAAGLRPMGVTEGERFKLNPLQANFTPTSFACAASNAIGQSDLSNSIDLRLSYTPGKFPAPPIRPIPPSRWARRARRNICLCAVGRNWATAAATEQTEAADCFMAPSSS